MSAQRAATPGSTCALLAGLLLGASDVALAQKSNSIMFDAPPPPSVTRDTPPPEPPPSSITGPAQSPLKFGSGRCTELARDVDALRGRPQRRLAAEQRFRAECQRDRQPLVPFGGSPSEGKPGRY